jgi:hypothetical protein
VFGLGLALRLGLIFRFPVIFGGDSMARILHRDQILLSHQLPLLQLIVYGISRVTHNYLIMQCAMALIGASAGAAFYFLLSDLLEERAAFLGALLLATNPFLAALSIVPYQESLMLGLLFLAFHFFYVNRPFAASLCLGLACFTRFEAWAAAPVLALAYIAVRGMRPAAILRGSLLFGWAPLAWIVFRRGLAPPGSFVVDPHLTAARLVRWVYLGYITFKFTPLIVFALGLAALWLLWRERRAWWLRLWPLAVFVGIFLVALIFSAHGDWPDPERRISAREAHILISAVVLLAAIALQGMQRYRVAFAVVGVAFGIWGAYRYVERESSDPHVLLAYRLAKYLDTAIQPGERVLILAPPWPAYVFNFYLDRARATGGEAQYQAALRTLAEADTSPPSYQRTLVHSRFDRDRLLWTPGTCTEWIAVWSDYSPQPDLPTPAKVLGAGDLRVNIARRTCPVAR